jgi:hypothetical protein
MRSRPFAALAITLVVAILVHWGFMLWAGDPDTGEWWALILPFALWGAAPFTGLGLAAWFARRSRAAIWLLLGVSLLLTVASALLLWDAFVASTDAQSGLVFVFLPIYQLVIAIPSAAVALFLGLRPRTASHET